MSVCKAVVEGYDVVEAAPMEEGPVGRLGGFLRNNLPNAISGQYVEYQIRVKREDGEFHIISKRYSDFVELHEALKAHFGEKPLPMDLPPKSLGRRFDPASLSLRKE